MSMTITSYNVISITGDWTNGMTLGTVRLERRGWRFFPHYQAQPSRKGWTTPEEALKGRLKNFRLEERMPGPKSANVILKV